MRKTSHHLRRAQRPSNTTGGLILLNRCSRAQLDNDQLRDLGLAYFSALHGMKSGHGSEQLWSTLACSINVAMVLAELGVMPQGLRVIELGQDALIRVRAHAQQTGIWALGIHAFAIDCAFKLHHQQIKEAGKAQVIAALEEVHRRVDAGQHL